MNARSVEADGFDQAPETPDVANDYAAGVVPSYMLDSERVKVYMTFSAMLSSGLSLKMVTAIYETENRIRPPSQRNEKKKGERVVEFFNTVLDARSAATAADPQSDVGLEATARIAESAAECFGDRFLSVEEITLLRSLAFAADMSAILDVAAKIVDMKSGITPLPRPGKPAAR